MHEDIAYFGIYNTILNIVVNSGKTDYTNYISDYKEQTELVSMEELRTTPF